MYIYIFYTAKPINVALRCRLIDLRFNIILTCPRRILERAANFWMMFF